MAIISQGVAKKLPASPLPRSVFDFLHNITYLSPFFLHFRHMLKEIHKISFFLRFSVRILSFICKFYSPQRPRFKRGWNPFKWSGGGVATPWNPQGEARGASPLLKSPLNNSPWITDDQTKIIRFQKYWELPVMTKKNLKTDFELMISGFRWIVWYPAKFP